MVMILDLTSGRLFWTIPIVSRRWSSPQIGRVTIERPGLFSAGAFLSQPDGFPRSSLAGGQSSGRWRSGAIVLDHSGSQKPLAVVSLKKTFSPTILAWDCRSHPPTPGSRGEKCVVGKDVETLKRRLPLLDYWSALSNAIFQPCGSRNPISLSMWKQSRCWAQARWICGQSRRSQKKDRKSAALPRNESSIPYPVKRRGFIDFQNYKLENVDYSDRDGCRGLLHDVKNSAAAILPSIRR